MYPCNIYALQDVRRFFVVTEETQCWRYERLAIA